MVHMRTKAAWAMALVIWMMGVAFGWLAVDSVFDRADVNRDGAVNVLDVQTVTNSFLQGD